MLPYRVALEGVHQASYVDFAGTANGAVEAGSAVPKRVAFHDFLFHVRINHADKPPGRVVHEIRHRACPRTSPTLNAGFQWFTVGGME